MVAGNYVDFAREQAYPTPFQNSPLLPLLLLSLTAQKHTPDTTSNIRKEYDYVIIGAGTAGSVVASRLSELESVSVLLLEAGPPPPILTEVPAISRSFCKTDIDWYFLTEPQKYTARLQGNRQAAYSAGRTIGGTSIIQSGVYARGSPQNYDAWEAQGARGWNWNEAFRNFIKSEDNRDPDFIKNGYHGVGGPLSVERFDLEPKFASAYVRALNRLGRPTVDPAGETQIGAADYQGNLRHHQRCSVAKGYLVPAENRTNLDILAEAYVTKIAIEGKRARGVHFDHKGICHEVRARKEVIVSAGTFKTPQILMLSGIGPMHVLNKFHIPVIQDLPVGLNLQSHGGPVAFFTGSRELPPFVHRLQDPHNIQKYIKTRRGLLASSEAIFGYSFQKEDPQSPPFNVPDYEHYFSEVDPPLHALIMNIAPQAYDQLLRPYENKTSFMCMAIPQQPRSRGYVTIRSTDPYAYPVVQPNHLQDPEDVRMSIIALRDCYKIASTPEMRNLGIRPIPFPGCHGDDHMYLECVARSLLFSDVHQVGTTKMGDPADPTTVLDPHLRVKGIRGLRVVDASIMPITPTGNTNNIVVMVAEKASEIIKKDLFSSSHRDISPFDLY